MDNDFLSGFMAGQGDDGGSNDMFGGGGVWAFLIIALLFGGNRFGNPQGQTPVVMDTGAQTRSAISEGFALNGLENGIRGIQQGLCDGFYAQNTTMLQGFNGLQQTMMQGFHGVDNNLCELSHQLSDCCCQTQRAIDGVNYNMATQTNALQQTMCSNTRDIIDATNCGARQILDFLTQDKIASLQAENQALKFSASQDRQNALLTTAMQAQTSQLIDRIAPYPVPSFPVCAPYHFGGAYGGYGYGGGYGRSGDGCGCGCGCAA